MKRPFAATVWREGKWYVSQCLELDVATRGETEEEARASSSVSPRVATSSSKHWETYHFPSRQTVAANGRFMTSFFHRAKLTRTLDVEMDGILPPMPGGRVMIEGTSHTESRKLYARDG